MTFLSSVLAALQAIPKILDALQALGDALAKRDLQKDIQAIQEATNKIEQAQSLSDYGHAIAGLRDAIKRL